KRGSPDRDSNQNPAIRCRRREPSSLAALFYVPLAVGQKNARKFLTWPERLDLFQRDISSADYCDGLSSSLRVCEETGKTRGPRRLDEDLRLFQQEKRRLDNVGVFDQNDVVNVGANEGVVKAFR